MYFIFMAKIVYFILLTCLYCFQTSLANDYKKDGPIERNSRSEDGYRGGMWFGPRLGKRTLRLSSENERQNFYRMLEAAEALKYYYNQLPYLEAQSDEPETRAATKKIIFTPKLGRSADEEEMRGFDNVNFTPRLGRKLPEGVGVTLPDMDSDRNDPDQVSTRTKYFSPRLGRNMNFSPRLGRDIFYDVFPADSRIRVVRSINGDKQRNNTTNKAN